MTRRSIAVDEFLGDYSPVVRETAHAARRVVLAALPEAHEAVISGWRLIGYRVPAGKGSAYVGYLAPLAGEVRLGFEWGVYLDDPNGVLAGGGTQVRYVSLTSPNDVRAELLIPLLQDAAELALLPRALRVTLPRRS